MQMLQQTALKSNHTITQYNRNMWCKYNVSIIHCARYIVFASMSVRIQTGTKTTHYCFRETNKQNTSSAFNLDLIDKGHLQDGGSNSNNIILELQQQQ